MFQHSRAACTLGLWLVIGVAIWAQAPEQQSLIPAPQSAGPAAPEASPPAQQAQAAAPDLPRIKLGVLSYISLQAGDLPAGNSQFLIKRTYINVEADVLPYMSVRVTPDARLSNEGVELRIKYAYAQFKAGGNGFVSSPTVQVGIVPTPWFPFEERVNRFRLQDPLFIERVGTMNSADTGVTVSGLLGGMLSDEARLASGNHAPGRYGSFAVGVYNGGGYAAREVNDNKVFQARMTARPLPAALPGLQASYFLVRGAGNLPDAPDWREDLIMASWEHPRAALSAQWLNGRGNQSGAAVDGATNRAWPHRGWSIFGEWRFGPAWSAIGRLDDFNQDTRTAGRQYRRAIGGIAYQLGRGNMVLADVDHRAWTGGDRPDETRFQLTLQISF